MPNCLDYFYPKYKSFNLQWTESWKDNIKTVTDIKYYLIFFNSALNPYAYALKLCLILPQKNLSFWTTKAIAKVDKSRNPG